MVTWWHAHAHSEYSTLDGMDTVKAMVAKVVSNGQPALALTDHGSMAGSFQLYRECLSAGIAPFPGTELYVVDVPVADTSQDSKAAPRFHLTVLAMNLRGYKGLVQLSSLSHQRDHYHRKPRIGMGELAQWLAMYGQDVVVLTGCYFGLVVQDLVQHGPRRASRRIDQLATIAPNLVIEVQRHGIDHGPEISETDTITALHDMALDKGVPLLATQDAHYCHVRQQSTHDVMKQVTLHGVGPDDAVFPGGPYHLCSSVWMEAQYSGTRILDSIWAGSEWTAKELLSNHDLVIPALDGSTYHVPQTKGSVAHRARKGLDAMGLTQPRYKKRLDTELKIIAHHGFGGYFVLIADACEAMAQREILWNTRGSANNSLVAYVLGITHVDPVKWKLDFLRFMSLDRTSPPDIDLDIEDERRNDVATWFRSRYGEAVQIGTYGTLGFDKWGRGSLWQRWCGSQRRNGTKTPFDKVDEISELMPTEYETLMALHRQKVRTSPGAHAAGYLLGTDEQPVADLVPTMLIPSSGNVVTQMTGEDVESAGYLKVDLLGLKTLTVVRAILKQLGKPGSSLDWIPMNDSKTLTAMRHMHPESGVFQFEGYATAKGLRELQPKSTRDAVLALALYRPAVLDSGLKDVFLKRRFYVQRTGKHRPSWYPHESVERPLRETYGVPVFQEQVIDMLRAIGLSVPDLNKLLKAVKQSTNKVAKAVATFTEMRTVFEDACRAKGFTDKGVAQAWAAVEGYAEYGFNRGHATAYALLAYRMAYLKTHHPKEFAVGLLQVHGGTPKEKQYVDEARRMGVVVRKADVNESGAWWRPGRRKSVRRGLVSIKGVGMSAAEAIEEFQPYTSVQDMCERVTVNGRVLPGARAYLKTGEYSGVVAALDSAGALGSLD